MLLPINYLAILLCAIAAVALGFLWYGPLFGKAWMKTMGINLDTLDPEEKKKGMKSMPQSIILTFIGALLSAYVLAHVLAFANAYFGTYDLAGNVMGAFWSWLGFTAPALVAAVLWEKRPWKYWFITAGYYLVSFALMAAILTASQ